MIKVNKLNKYYNYKKNNQIHVINDANIEFPSTGFISLLGPSGCGKTTLLNAISGLDKVKSGEIIIDGQEIKKYKFDKWDDVRTKKIGYIFQNYLLLQDFTVYKNLEIVLKMLNVPKDKIDERIDYALKAVKMDRFKKRKTSQLSGGQMQRVAIARALVKSPKVIIADEPTGNLDENNTTQIMNILRKVSKECLVILVTHEPRLAEFYSDRIVKLADGKIIEDIVNKSSNSFEFSEDRNIYLQEYTKKEVLGENVNVEYFYKDNIKNTNIKIIFEKDSIYISADSEKAKIKFIDSSNEIKILDHKKPVVKVDDFDKFDYDLEKLPDSHVKSAIKFKDAFLMALQHVLSFTKKQKLFLFGFALIAIFIVITAISFSSTYIKDKSEYIYNDKNLVSISNNPGNIANVTYEKLMDIKEDLEISGYVNRTNGFKDIFSSLPIEFFLQTRSNFIPLNGGAILLLEDFDEENLLYGTMPSDESGVIIDKWVLDEMVKGRYLTPTGLVDFKDLIGVNLSIPLNIIFPPELGSEELEKRGFNITIAGISASRSPSIYMNKDLLYTLSFFNKGFGYIGSNSFVETSILLADNEVLVNEIMLKNSEDGYLVGDTYLVGGESFIVKGLFPNDANLYHCIINSKAVEKIYLKNLLINFSNSSETNITFLAKSTNGAKKALEENSINYKIPYDEDVKAFETGRALEVTASLTALIVMLVASSLILFFLIRSSIMLRINQIGTYRAIGAKRRDIYKIFFSEIFLITTMSSLLGFLFMSSIIWTTSKNILFNALITYPWYVAVATIIFIYAINILAGLIPVFRLMRLTPTQIITKYDI